MNAPDLLAAAIRRTRFADGRYSHWSSSADLCAWVSRIVPRTFSGDFELDARLVAVLLVFLHLERETPFGAIALRVDQDHGERDTFADEILVHAIGLPHDHVAGGLRVELRRCLCVQQPAEACEGDANESEGLHRGLPGTCASNVFETGIHGGLIITTTDETW